MPRGVYPGSLIGKEGKRPIELTLALYHRTMPNQPYKRKHRLGWANQPLEVQKLAEEKVKEFISLGSNPKTLKARAVSWARRKLGLDPNMSQMGKLSLTKRKQHSRAKTLLGLQSKKVYPLGKDVSPRGSYRPSAVHEIEPSKTGQTNMDGV